MPCFDGISLSIKHAARRHPLREPNSFRISR
jgi:hypothetical protein